MKLEFRANQLQYATDRLAKDPTIADIQISDILDGKGRELMYPVTTEKRFAENRFVSTINRSCIIRAPEYDMFVCEYENLLDYD